MTTPSITDPVAFGGDLLTRARQFAHQLLEALWLPPITDNQPRPDARDTFLPESHRSGAPVVSFRSLAHSSPNSSQAQTPTRPGFAAGPGVCDGKGDSANTRNIGIVGHVDVGKTALLETLHRAARPLRDPDCTITAWDHRCTNRDGDPIRDGQACWHSARSASLKTFEDTHSGWKGVLA